MEHCQHITAKAKWRQTARQSGANNKKLKEVESKASRLQSMPCNTESKRQNEAKRQRLRVTSYTLQFWRLAKLWHLANVCKFCFDILHSCLDMPRHASRSVLFSQWPHLCLAPCMCKVKTILTTQLKETVCYNSFRVVTCHILTSRRDVSSQLATNHITMATLMTLFETWKSDWLPSRLHDFVLKTARRTTLKKPS